LSEKAGFGCRADEFFGAGEDHSDPRRVKQRWIGSVGGKWMYILDCQRAKKLIPVKRQKPG
jgi:hypothetical protein